ncbi:MAG: TonB-dependent receptor [Vicingus serpentipes]|nr:TonB-dependent receptor [Vicingus serpentipes]
MNKKYIGTLSYPISRLLLCILICFTYVSTQAQDSTTATLPLQQLPEFSVSEKLDKLFSKINTQKIDSNILQLNNTNDLATLLSKNSAVTIKPYGVTGLSSISMRGGNSNHTAILWNGFNLQDPLNGGFNFSTSTINFVDAINVQHGGGSAAYGSGAIGGTIHLDNQPVFNNAFFGSISYKMGSYGLNAITAEVGHSKKKIATRFRLFRNYTNNDFEFQNNAKIGSPIEKYGNAQKEQYGLLYEIYYKPNKNQILSTQLWGQHNYRDIPPSIISNATESNREENQNDQWLRWALNWNKTGEKVNYEARTGIFYNQLNYKNATINLNSYHSSLRNISEALTTVAIFKSLKTTAGINNNYTTGISENFNNTPSLNTTALYISPNVTLFEKLTLIASFRDEFYQQKFKPITYSFNGKYRFYKGYYLTASFSKNYRTPTFNDLYWGGNSAKGNLDLEDEYGYSKDVGIGIKSLKKKTHLSSSVSFYQNTTNNLIVWSPQGQNWSPQNVKLVETKGVEFLFSSKYKLQKQVQLYFNLTYAYTDAQVKEKSFNESEEILNKQLIYTPYYQANNSLGICYKNISLDVNIQYSDYQFTRADNLDGIEAYTLTDVGSQYQLKRKKYNLLFSGKVNNVFNISYEVRQWYPMPKMNYEIGIKLIIK